MARHVKTHIVTSADKKVTVIATIDIERTNSGGVKETRVRRQSVAVIKP
jgi:hypothetical protein